MKTLRSTITHRVRLHSAKMWCVAVLYALNAGTLLVQIASAQDAYEPDNTAAEAKVINGGQTQNRNIHAAGNVDWFRFTLPTAANTSYALKLETAGASGDTVIYLYGPNSSTALVENNDDDGAGNFSLITRTQAEGNLLAAGTYYVKVEEFGNDGTIPAYTIRADWTAVIPPLPPNEPNDSPGQATTASHTQTLSGSIHQVGDVDWYRFTLAARSDVVIETMGTAGDTIVYLYGPNSSTTLIDADNDDGVDRFSQIVRQGTRALNPGTYYVKVEEYGNNGTIADYSLIVCGPAVEVWDFLVVCKSGVQPTVTLWDSIKRNFRLAANYLYDATDGQVRIGRVTLKNFNPIDAT